MKSHTAVTILPDETEVKNIVVDPTLEHFIMLGFKDTRAGARVAIYLSPVEADTLADRIHHARLGDSEPAEPRGSVDPSHS